MTSFQPTHLADFAIHYQGKRFLVHKLLLHHHSDVFRKLFRSALSRCNTCPVDCVDLAKLVDNEVSADSLLELLNYLYYPIHFRFAPYKLNDHSKLSKPSPDTSLIGPRMNFPNYSAEQVQSLPLYSENDECETQWDVVVAAQSLGCVQFVQWCEQNIMQMMKLNPTSDCWDTLVFADQMDLKEVVNMCISAIISDPQFHQAETYKQHKQDVSVEMWETIVIAQNAKK